MAVAMAIKVVLDLLSFVLLSVQETARVSLLNLLGKYLHLGSAGVVLAATVSLGWGAVLGPIQTHKLLWGTASGIANKAGGCYAPALTRQ